LPNQNYIDKINQINPQNNSINLANVPSFGQKNKGLNPIFFKKNVLSNLGLIN